jgi:hypothetical protein
VIGPLFLPQDYRPAQDSVYLKPSDGLGVIGTPTRANLELWGNCRFNPSDGLGVIGTPLTRIPETVK